MCGTCGDLAKTDMEYSNVAKTTYMWQRNIGKSQARELDLLKGPKN